MAYLGRKGASAALTTADIPDNSITSAKIVDGAVAVADLGPNSVDSSELVDGSIDTSHIADDQVTGDKLANDIAISTSGAITTTGAFTSIGIDDNADANAITIDSGEKVTMNKPFQANGHTGSIPSILEGSGNGDVVELQFKVKANDGSTSTQGIYANAGSDSTYNRIWLGNSESSGLVVNANGYVGINGNPNANQFQIESNKTTGITAWFDHQAASGTCFDIRNAGSGHYFAGRNAFSNYAVIIYADGDIENDNNSYGAYSDERLKKNIVDATPKLDELNKLRVVNFNWKHSDKNSGGNSIKQLGFIGQEVKEIFPGIVTEKDTRDIIDELEYKNYSEEEKALFKKDDDGKWCRVLEDGSIKGNKDGLSMKYSVLVPMLVKGLQELSAKNDALEAENTALKTRMDALEARVTALEG